jgi:hypothetical protein
MQQSSALEANTQYRQEIPTVYGTGSLITLSTKYRQFVYEIPPICLRNTAILSTKYRHLSPA